MLLEKSDLEHPVFKNLNDLVKTVFSPKYDREFGFVDMTMGLLLAITDFSNNFPLVFNLGNWFVVNLNVFRK